MDIAVLGTGVVGRTLAEGLRRDGHVVVIGTRDTEQTLARDEEDAHGNPPFKAWQKEHREIGLADYAEAARKAEVVVNATGGTVSLEVLELTGSDNLEGKILVDVSNALDFSQGFPPILAVCNTDSIGEQIQRAHPECNVVKALNTINARIMTEPNRVPGDHNIFVAGDDDDAKAMVKGLLEAFGWPIQRIIDVGGIRASRGLEMYLPLWATLMAALGTPEFNIQIRRG